MAVEGYTNEIYVVNTGSNSVSVIDGFESVYLYEVEEGKRSKYEIVDMIETQRELLLKEFSRMEDVGDG
jgi:DNA-binding beta-propeller fold protein YncE